jgi:hypothetical protein
MPIKATPRGCAAQPAKYNTATPDLVKGDFQNARDSKTNLRQAS